MPVRRHGVGRVALAEAGVRLAGGALEGQHVVDRRVESGELAGGLAAPLLDADPQPATFSALLGEVQLRRGCDEADRLIWVGMDIGSTGSGVCSLR